MVDMNYYLKIPHSRCLAWGLYNKRCVNRHKKIVYCNVCECYIKIEVRHLHFKCILHRDNVINYQKNLFN